MEKKRTFAGISIRGTRTTSKSNHVRTWPTRRRDLNEIFTWRLVKVQRGESLKEKLISRSLNSRKSTWLEKKFHVVRAINSRVLRRVELKRRASISKETRDNKKLKNGRKPYVIKNEKRCPKCTHISMQCLVQFICMICTYIYIDRYI